VADERLRNREDRQHAARIPQPLRCSAGR
jgi:hypothetical protein